MSDVSRVGYFFGKLAKDDDKDKKGEELINLKKGLEKFFDGIKELEVGNFKFDFQFQTELKERNLITKSECPIHKYFSRWCDSECLKFVEGFASAFGDIRVRRISKQPESEHCIFEFEIGE